ncbi:MAG TPA: ankyrin repeat domain-containing protein [Micavibrio sp.]|nr:ankyrin repeat domain-containing protein [Micavibrio sp.]HIL29689.1 ankyrin repeat domain-containing protein [Micavibrio sp.]
MNKQEIIARLRTIFSDIVMSVEDCEYDAPEDRTGETMDFLKYRGSGDDTLLHTAAIRGELEGAKLLLKLGVPIDYVGDMGNTALHYAADFGNLDVYKYLVSQGASQDIVNEFGCTPKQYLEQRQKKNT